MNTALRARALLAGAAVLALAACSPSDPSSGVAHDAADLDSFGHVHDLVHDAGSGDLYAATHTGVWLLPDLSRDVPGATPLPDAAAVRVGTGTQDTMGMTLGGDGALYASGHPGPGEAPDLSPPNLGLMRSVDGAATWESVSLRGEVDFHALTTASTPDGLRVAGLDSGSSTVLVSDDGGRTWSDGATLALRDLAFVGVDGESLLATTAEGLQVSRDAGRTFASLPGAPRLVLVDVLPDGSLVGLDENGTVWTGDAGLADWSEHGATTDVVQALTAVPSVDGGGPVVVVATKSGVLTSRDLGVSWDGLVTA